MQGKAIPSFVRQKIIESRLVWKGPSQIGQEMRLPKKPLPKLLIFSFAGGISKTTNEEISLGQRVLNDVNNYMECCKTTCTTPAIQNKPVKNNVPMIARKCPVACMQPQRNARSWFIFFQEIQRYSTGITDSLPVFNSLRGQRIFVMSVQCSFPRSSAQNSQVRHLIDIYVMKFSSSMRTYEIHNELRKSPVKSFVKCTVRVMYSCRSIFILVTLVP